MKERTPGNYSTEIADVAECAFQRAIILGEYSCVKGERIDWIDIELPVDDSNSPRGKCIDLIGKDSKKNYVLCELKFRKNSDNGSPAEAVRQLKEYYEYIVSNRANLKDLGHTNAKEKIDWEKVAGTETRLMVVANSSYWDYWLNRSRKREQLTDTTIEYYSVNIDGFIFKEQKGENKKYVPSMPEDGLYWEEKP